MDQDHLFNIIQIELNILNQAEEIGFSDFQKGMLEQHNPFSLEDVRESWSRGWVKGLEQLYV